MIERAVILANGEVLTLADLPEEFSRRLTHPCSRGAGVARGVEAEHVRRILAVSATLETRLVLWASIRQRCIASGRNSAVLARMFRTTHLTPLQSHNLFDARNSRLYDRDIRANDQTDPRHELLHQNDRSDGATMDMRASAPTWPGGSANMLSQRVFILGLLPLLLLLIAMAGMRSAPARS